MLHHAAFFIGFRLNNRHAHEVKGVIERNKRPEQRNYPPVCRADKLQHKRCHGNGEKLSPTIKRMEQAHRSLFAVARERFDRRADDNLGKTSADGIEHSRYYQTRIGRHYHRKKCKADKPRDICEMRRHHKLPVCEVIAESGGKQVDKKLCRKVYQHECAEQ